jgi:hypothetical protein
VCVCDWVGVNTSQKRVLCPVFSNSYPSLFSCVHNKMHLVRSAQQLAKVSRSHYIPRFSLCYQKCIEPSCEFSRRTSLSSSLKKGRTSHLNNSKKFIIGKKSHLSHLLLACFRFLSQRDTPLFLCCSSGASLFENTIRTKKYISTYFLSIFASLFLYPKLTVSCFPIRRSLLC